MTGQTPKSQKRCRLARLGVACLAFLLAVSALVAQETPQGEAAQAEEQPIAEDSGTVLDSLLRAANDPYEIEAVYDPRDRRDPFRSLLVVRASMATDGPRPEGIPGLMIGDIDVTGIFIMGGAPVAQVMSTQGDKSYLVREGDELYDGDVVSIGRSEVVFKQIVDDPTAVKPFREVVKKLNP